MKSKTLASVGVVAIGVAVIVIFALGLIAMTRDVDREIALANAWLLSPEVGDVIIYRPRNMQAGWNSPAWGNPIKGRVVEKVATSLCVQTDNEKVWVSLHRKYISLKAVNGKTFEDFKVSH